MKTNKHLIFSGLLFTIVLFLWGIFMSISQPQGNIGEQFKWILNHLVLYNIQYFFVLLIGPSIIYLMFSQLDKYPADHKITYRIGNLFLNGYFVLNSIVYASQVILVPKLLSSGLTDQANVWYFGSSTSIVFFINQMGYCFWGLGTIFLFFRLMNEKGMIKYLSIIYLISAILSVVAFIGLILDNKLITSMTLFSGLAQIPIGVMTIIWGLKDNKNKKMNS
jgi:hypothetical protein